MAGFDHGSNEPDEQENIETINRNTRWGLKLFAVYLVLYGGFVFLNTFSPAKMEVVVFAGLNLAIVYGFTLIIAAFVLAIIYGWLCRNDLSSSSSENEEVAQ
ncbi:DUF485 domain-containing protein [Gimesia aquarii]|uniref:Inner membrane protein YjcH n=1 Tax=Gimesia aquarii TaxID=2527964 RepID=A0A517WZ64_9PLAN|nr:DUF485 domain-containing protein [Gimesia aquarii]QDT96983.1 hypothetical protein V144x_24540 [Gimesia aquarii]QDU10545.1 hypothetical protein V202x_39570 [Gimesia aquarii]